MWCVVCGVWCVVCGVRCAVCGVWGLEFGIWGWGLGLTGFRVWGAGSGEYARESRGCEHPAALRIPRDLIQVWSLGFGAGVWGSGCRVWGLGFGA